MDPTMISELCTYRPHPTNIDLVRVSVTCCECRAKAGFDIHEAEWFSGLMARQEGAPIQQAFPTLKPEHRELLISRICPRCFDRITHD